MSRTAVAYAKVRNRRSAEVGEGYGAAVSQDTSDCDMESRRRAAIIAVFNAATNANCQNENEIDLVGGNSVCVTTSPALLSRAEAFARNSKELVERIVSGTQVAAAPNLPGFLTSE